jgi:hypothetical protein
VELFEEIRREYEFGVGPIAGVARKVKVHRRMGREAMGRALPQPRKKTERPHAKLQAAIPFIDQILQGDRQAPRKQRHPAHRANALRQPARRALIQGSQTSKTDVGATRRRPNPALTCRARLVLVSTSIVAAMAFF